MINTLLQRIVLNARDLTYGSPFVKGYRTGRILSSANTIDIISKAEHDKPLSENDIFSNNFVNRNPRNLEQMFLARKPSGFGLDHLSKKYWNKLVLHKSNRYFTAKVVHNSGKTVLSASTSEWAISKQLYSNTDLCAVENVASVLAQRCLESGILFVHCDFTPEELATSRVQIFLKKMEENGVKLSEPDQIRPRLHPDL